MRWPWGEIRAPERELVKGLDKGLECQDDGEWL